MLLLLGPVRAKTGCELPKLLSPVHHEFWVRVNFVDKFREHGSKFLNRAFRSQKLGNLLQSLDRVKLRVGVFRAQVVDEQRYSANLIDIVLVHFLVLHLSHFPNLNLQITDWGFGDQKPA